MVKKSFFNNLFKEIITRVYSLFPFLHRLRALLFLSKKRSLSKLLIGLPIIFWIYRKIYFKKYNKENKKKANKKGVNIFGYLLSESGLGESARGIVRAIHKTELSYNLISVDDFCKQRKGDYSILNFSQLSRENSHDINLLSFNPNLTEILAIEKGFNSISNKYNIGYWYWEFGKLPKHWTRNTIYYNEIWVCLLYTSPSPRDRTRSRMPSSA